MITEWFPEAKKVALLFCSAEPNSSYQIQEVATCLANKGIETKEFAFTDSNDVASVTQSAADYADVVYLPTDNTAASNTEAIANILVPAGVPAICGEEGICYGYGARWLPRSLPARRISPPCPSNTPTPRPSITPPSARSWASSLWTAMRPLRADPKQTRSYNENLAGGGNPLLPL